MSDIQPRYSKATILVGAENETQPHETGAGGIKATNINSGD